MYASHFSLANIPYGIASKTPNEAPSVVTRLFDTVVFLDELANAGLLSDLPSAIVATFKQVRQPHILPVWEYKHGNIH
jgi:fumarylacetoacetase